MSQVHTFPRQPNAQQANSQQHKSVFSQHLQDYSVIIVPGLRNSDEQHWQSLWQQQLPHSQRIQLANWHTPDLKAWKSAIRQQLVRADKPVLLIAHSFGALASASVAEELPGGTAALFLVAPADPEKFGIAQQLPQSPLASRTKLIASSNDPWLSESKAARLALHWGADFLRLKEVGHINSESQLGMWQRGITELETWLEKRPLALPRAPKRSAF